MLNGVTVKFGGDQAKLMENLSKSVTGSSKGIYSGKGQPKEDLLKAGKDFATVIPTGFLVLHKDLQELIKGGGASKGGGLGDLTNMLPTMFAAVGAVAIAGMVVAGLFGSMSPKSGSHISELVDELNGRLTVDDLANDPEVLEAQHKGVATYVKSFFIAQSASAVLTATLGAVGSGAAEAVINLVGGLFGKETKDEAQLHLKDLIDNIILRQKLDDWAPGGQFWDDALQKEVSIGLRVYLGTWFAAQAVSMTAETVAGGVGDAIGGAINGLFKSLFGKQTEETSVGHLKAIIDSIILGQKTDDWAPNGKYYDKALELEVSLGIRTYLGLWFAAQAISMTAETVAQGAGQAVGGVLTGLFKGIGSAFGVKFQSSSDHLKEIIDQIILAQDPQDWADKAKTDGALKTEVGIGIGSYLALWFAAQAVSMTAESIAQGAGQAVGGVITGLFRGIGSAFGIDNSSSGHLKKIIDAIINGQKEDTWVKESNTSGSSLYNEVKLGIQAYLGAWFAMQALQLSVESTANSVGSVLGGYLNGVFTSLFGVKESPLEAKINSVIDSVISGVNPDDPGITESPEVQAGVKEGIASYIKTYFQMMATQAAADQKSSGVKEAVGNAAKKVWNWLSGNKEETAVKEDPVAQLGKKLNTVLTSVITQVDASKLNQEDYDAMVMDGISAFVSGYLASFASAADENQKAIKNLLKDDTDLAKSVLNMYKEIFKGLDLKDTIDDLRKKIVIRETSSIVEAAEEIFKEENKNIKKHYESNMSGSKINSYLSNVSEAYLKAVKENLEKSFNINTSASITTNNDSAGILNALSVIQAQLSQLTGNTEDIKGNQGTMAGLYAASMATESAGGSPAISTLSGTEE